MAEQKRRKCGLGFLDLGSKENHKEKKKMQEEEEEAIKD